MFRRLPVQIPRLWLLPEQFKRGWMQRIRTAADDEVARLCQLQARWHVPQLLAWARYFFPHYLTLPPSRLHCWLIDRLQGQHLSRGTSLAVVAPRSGAKTTWCTKLYVLYAICEAFEPYILLVSNTELQARRNLAAIQFELLSNDALAEWYPQACGRGPESSRQAIVTRNGIKVESLGSGTSARGATFRHHRPSLIIIDDLMEDEAARSEVQREHMWEWFTRALLPMGDVQTNFLFVGTALHRDDPLQRLQRTAGWEFATFRSLIQEPTRSDLWSRWRELYCDPLNRQRGEAAWDFYQQNRSEMNRGAVVLWPESESLYDLMVFRNRTSESAFQAEKQGNPSAASRSEWPDELFPESIWFHQWPETTFRVMSLDPSKGHRDTADYSAFVMLGMRADRDLLVDADLARRDMTRIVQDGIRLALTFQPHVILIEANQFQELLAEEFLRVSRGLGIELPVLCWYNRSAKTTRIRSLGSLLHTGRLHFKSHSVGASLLVEQLREFPFASHDDGPDALEMAVRGLEQLEHGQIGIETCVPSESWTAA